MRRCEEVLAFLRLNKTPEESFCGKSGESCIEIAGYKYLSTSIARKTEQLRAICG